MEETSLKPLQQKRQSKAPINSENIPQNQKKQVNQQTSTQQTLKGGSLQPATKQTAPSQLKSPNVPQPPQKTSPLALFDHLPRKQVIQNSDLLDSDRSLHPATIKIGLLYRQGLIREDDDRTAALLAAFCNIIEDYKTPPNKNLSWDLDKHIRIQVQHLVSCRQHNMGMGNLIKYLRATVSKISPEMNEAEAKKLIISKLHSFLEEKILYSREIITDLISKSNTIIHENDVVMTFGSSPLLRQILIETAKVKSYKLIIIDTRPLNEGLLTLELLSPLISCTYTSLMGVSSLLRTTNKVLLGASALLSNGAMFAPAGTAMVASLAKSFGIPVIVACEGYKFCEKVQVDSIVYNELGSINEIAIIDTFSTEENATIPQLKLGYQGILETKTNENQLAYNIINLRYDLTPINNISAIATETGLIPPTSIPVLLRESKGENSFGNTE